MNQARVLWHLLRADFLERVRRYSFLVTLALAALLGYTVAAGKMKLWVGDFRGVYNSAWVGILMALVANTFLTLAGFYVVKNSVERDRQTGVGQILATTPMSKTLYTLGKTASNLAVLLAMVAVLAVMTVGAQLVAGEERRIEVWPLLSPFLFLVLPAMALTAAAAVLFETVPGLKGGFGNVVWFFTYMAAMPLAVKGLHDPFGLGPVSGALFKAFGVTNNNFVLGGVENEADMKVVSWAGMDWTAEILLYRLLWLLAAVGVALVAALLFDRFDPAQGWFRRRRPATAAENGNGTVLAAEAAMPAIPHHLDPLPEGSRRFSFLDLLKAELRLMLKGQRWWWYAVAGGLVVGGLAAPLENSRSIALPFAWIWPLLIWSSLGNRESRFATGELVFSAARPLERQLPTVWLSGVLLAVLTGSGVGLRMALEGDWAGVGAWLVGALFIPTFALFLGVWTGNSKAFEATYLLLWYIGPLNRTASLDFMGAVPAGMPWVWLALTAGLAAAAMAGRRRQLAGG